MYPFLNLLFVFYKPFLTKFQFFIKYANLIFKTFFNWAGKSQNPDYCLKTERFMSKQFLFI